MRRNLPDAPLLQAARGETPSRTPVWFMRQAGRSLPEYRAIRATIGMLDACFTPDVLAEITLQPVRRHDMDAAILFSDIVVPLKAAGVDIDILAGRGPVVDSPIRSLEDVQRLPSLDDVPEVTEGIHTILAELSDTQALIGFAGAPFTLASYLVEGGPSRNHELTKTMMHAEEKVWHALMERLVGIIATFLDVQIEAGVDAVQLFDSWAGFLNERDYRRYVLPYSTQIMEHVAGIPRIHFGVATGELLGAMSEAGSEVMGVDWRVPLDAAARRISAARAAQGAPQQADSPRAVAPVVLQGNLDPALLFAGTEVLTQEIAEIKAQAARAIQAGDARGHIFNLGHGVLPSTDPDAITEAVRIIHG